MIFGSKVEKLSYINYMLINIIKQGIWRWDKYIKPWLGGEGLLEVVNFQENWFESTQVIFPKIKQRR